MAKLSAAMKKLNVKEAIVWLAYDHIGTYSYPELAIQIGWREYRLRFQRDALSLNDPYGDTPWHKNRVVMQAEEIAGTFLDIGRLPYGICYAPHWERLAAEDTCVAADLWAAISKARAYTPGKEDELTPMIDALRKLGVPVTIRYTGYGKNSEYLYGVPGDCQGHASKLTNSVEAAEAKAAYFNQVATEKKERAATAAAQGEAHV